MHKAIITSESKFIPKTIQDGNSRSYPVLAKMCDPNSNKTSFGLTLLRDFPQNREDYTQVSNSDHSFPMYLLKKDLNEYIIHEHELDNQINNPTV